VKPTLREPAAGGVATTASVHRADLGVVLAAVSVFLGARAGEHMPWAAATVAAVGLAGVPLAVAAGTRSRRLHRVPGILALAALGAASMARAVSGLDGPAARLAAGDMEATAGVRLTADPQGRWTGVRVPARLATVNGARARGLVLVAARAPAAERLRLLEAGESAVLTGRFRPLEEGEQRWRWRHVGAVFEAGDLLGAGRATGFLRWANGARHRVLAGGEALGPTDRALVAGFLVGDDRDLPPAVARDFRAAGLSHLLVVSGANVTLALALVAPVLRRFSLMGRLAGGAAALLLFCAMTRFEPSVLRAGAMSGLALLAAFVGRPVSGLRLLALAVAGLVLVDPFLVHSLGFGLSCGASAGILLLSGPLARRLPGHEFVREPLAVTAAAQIGVAPIALPAFGSLPLAALPANLAAAPAAAALSLWGLASGLAGSVIAQAAGPADRGPAAVLQIPTAALAGWIRRVAHLAARSPVSIGTRPAALIAVAIGVWIARRRSRVGANPGPVFGARRSGGILFEPQPMVEGQQPGAGQQQRSRGYGEEQVELVAAPAAPAEDADVPLHLGHDQQELGGGQGAPEPGQQAERQADTADQFDGDGGPGQ
jgi:competence protein ComEC